MSSVFGRARSVRGGDSDSFGVAVGSAPGCRSECAARLPGICPRCSERMVRSGHDPQGLNQFVDVATVVGVMPYPSRLGSCPSFTRRPAARGSGSRRRVGRSRRES